MSKDKFSHPSKSIASARRMRTLLSVYQFSVDDTSSPVARMEIKEVWTENVIEYYESVPIKKGIAHQRLCIRAALQDTSVAWKLKACARNNSGTLVCGIERVISSEECVFSIDSSRIDVSAKSLTFFICDDSGQILLKIAAVK